MKIDGVNWAGTVSNQASLGELGLKDGQSIVGRIISITENAVLLQIAGKTLTAKLEGQPLPAGTVALFGVTLEQSGQVELKVLSNPVKPIPEGVPENPVSANIIDKQTEILAVCRKLGWEASMGQVGRINREMQLFTAQHGKTPPTEVFVWLKMQNWPVTPGSVLIVWLQRDRELRDLIWTRLRWFAEAKRQPELLPPVYQLEQGHLLPVSIPAEKQMATGVRPSPGNTLPFDPESADELLKLIEPLPDFGATGKDQAVLAQLRPLLEQSANLERATANLDSTAAAIIPFLIQTAALVTELSLEWNSRPSSTGAPVEKEELIRMVIPTANMGAIHLAMLVSEAKTQINLKVASAAIRDYFNRHLAELKKQLTESTHIAVSLAPKNNTEETKVDLWM